MTGPAVNQRPPGLWHRTLDLLLPQPCRFCAETGADGCACCRPCRADLPWLASCCAGCALPLTTDAGDLCGRCAADRSFRRAFAAFRYEWPVDTLIKGLKYNGRLADGRLLGQLLASHLASLRAPRPEAIVPLPLHDRRLRRRGFNQAGEIARQLSFELGLPTIHDLLFRRRETAPQPGLSAAARRRNLQGVFACRLPRGPRHVALVDDVVTTTATVTAAAACLRRAGIERVDVWAVARAPL